MIAGSGVPVSGILSEEHPLNRNVISLNLECRLCLYSSWSHCRHEAFINVFLSKQHNLYVTGFCLSSGPRQLQICIP